MNHYLHSVVSLHRTISFMHNAQCSNVHNCTGDQKVYVHLIITIQSPGAHRPSDHPVCVYIYIYIYTHTHISQSESYTPGLSNN